MSRILQMMLVDLGHLLSFLQMLPRHVLSPHVLLIIFVGGTRRFGNRVTFKMIAAHSSDDALPFRGHPASLAQCDRLSGARRVFN